MNNTNFTSFMIFATAKITARVMDIGSKACLGAALISASKGAVDLIRGNKSEAFKSLGLAAACMVGKGSLQFSSHIVDLVVQSKEEDDGSDSDDLSSLVAATFNSLWQ